MTFPIWMLLGFAAWTVLLLLGTVGVYRWRRILTGRAPIESFRADGVEGTDFYPRAMRAHANCVENLPVFGAIVFALHASGLSSGATDAMAATVLVARILQSVVHVAFEQTSTVTSLRFACFFTQILCFAALIAAVIRHAS